MTAAVFEQFEQASEPQEVVAVQHLPFFQLTSEGLYRIDPKHCVAPSIARIALLGESIQNLYERELNASSPAGTMTPVHNDNETVINVAFDNPERMSAALQRYLDDVGHVAPDERGIAGLMIHELHALSAQSGDNQNTVPVVLE